MTRKATYVAILFIAMIISTLPLAKAVAAFAIILCLFL